MNTYDLARIAAVAGAWYLALAVASCAANSPPRSELDDAQAAISEAQRMGAESAAAPEIARARGKLELGLHYLSQKDYKPARWLFEQAEVDAELAQMKSEASAAMQEAASQARQARLQREAPRGGR